MNNYFGSLKLCLPLKCIALMCAVFMCASCASSPAPAPSNSGGNSNSGASAAEAIAAAQAALDRMDGKAPASSPGSSSTGASASTPATSAAANTPAPQGTTTVNTSKTKPAWVDSVESVYNRNQYAAAVGHNANREMAEKSAFANLISIFGQSIFADQTIIDRYNEATQNGVTTNWSKDISSENKINITTSMDTLVGAEIREVWFDSKTYHAVAVMENARTARIYNEMIQANVDMINNLTTMSAAEKNSLDGYSRYQFAATVADINTSYVNVLRVIGAAVPGDLKKGDDYRIEAQNITKAIPIGVTVKNDKSGRIQGAFAKAFSDLGFRSGGNNSRYVLDVNIAVSPVDLPNNPNKFARIELSANLTDQKAVLLPYNFNQREGHTSYSEAENRTYTVAERKINEEYSKLLSEYLSRLLPKR